LKTLGTHCILELYGCPFDMLNDHEHVINSLSKAARHGLATLLKHVSHQFHPQGVTALCLLAESHMSIHTWPEDGYAALDIFTCGETAQPRTACDYMVDAMQAQRFSLRVIHRGMYEAGQTPPVESFESGELSHVAV